MLYGSIKILMTLACRLFYRRIYATGFESIPSFGPVIIIANHASSLMDAALLGILVERPVFFFTRGDIFKNKWAAKILDAFHMIPVHSYESDRNSLAINNSSYLKASAILAKGGIVVFFPEGISHTERKILPFRKGAFRLAFQSIIPSGIETKLLIVPAGISYSHPSAYQSDVMIHLGKPIMLKDYQHAYRVHPASALLQLTKDSFQAIDPLVVHTGDESKLELLEQCLTITRNNYDFYTSQCMQATLKKLTEEKNLCYKLDTISSRDIMELKFHCEEYNQLLNKHHLNDLMLSSSFRLMSTARLISLIAGFPIFMAGFLLNFLPIIIARKIADTKVYRVDFYSWVFVSGALMLYLVWVLVLAVGSLIAGWQFAIWSVLVTVITGLFAHAYLPILKRFRQSLRLKVLQRRYPQLFLHLHRLRSGICNAVR